MSESEASTPVAASQQGKRFESLQSFAAHCSQIEIESYVGYHAETGHVDKKCFFVRATDPEEGEATVILDACN